MTSKPDGGPAHPFGNPAGCEPRYGMTLRDYIAAAALQGLVQCPGLFAGGKPCDTPELQAELAYVYADALLAERSK